MTSGLEKLIEIVAKLRDPVEGCPWDLEQDHQSLMPYFFEELHEFKEALDGKGAADPSTVEELGDVLYQVAIHAQLLSEKGTSDLDQIADATAEKIRRRHPHVFDPQFPKFKTGAEVTAAWEKIKAASKRPTVGSSATPTLSENTSLSATQRLQDVPRQLPSLQRAARIGEKASGFNFDWNNANEIIAKLDEEIAEFKVDRDHEEKGQEELGDVLFVIAQLARKKGWDPEKILQKACDKFLYRFEKIEKSLNAEGIKVEDAGNAKLEATWQKIKKTP